MKSANSNYRSNHGGACPIGSKDIETKKSATLTEAERRARELRVDLQTRGVHPNVLKFCKAELVVDN